MKLKNTKMATLAATLITFGSLAGRADAVVLYTSGTSASIAAAIGVRSSAPSLQTVATTFSLASDSALTGFTAEGIYQGVQGTTIYDLADDLFQIALHSDSGFAVPGSLLGSTISTSVFSRSDTGVDYLDGTDTYDIFSFSVEFPASVNLNAGDYWISIINSTPADPDSVWSWSFSSTGGPSDPRYASNSTDQLSAYTFTTNRSMVFTVEGSAIPEPSSALLLGLGVLGFAARARRMRTA